MDDRSYRDRLELTSDEFFRKLRAGLDAGTSQPPPQAFTDAYQDAARAGDHVIAVIILSAWSGTFANGDAAAPRARDALPANAMFGDADHTGDRRPRGDRRVGCVLSE